MPREERVEIFALRVQPHAADVPTLVQPADVAIRVRDTAQEGCSARAKPLRIVEDVAPRAFDFATLDVMRRRQTADLGQGILRRDRDLGPRSAAERLAFHRPYLS